MTGLIERFFYMILGIALLASAEQSFGQTSDHCPFPRRFIPHEQIKIEGDRVLIVTHPTDVYDGRRVAKPGIDKTMAWATAQKIPTIMLWEPDPALNHGYYPEQCHADFIISSTEGEHGLKNLPNHIISIGGRFDRLETTGCQMRTMRDIFKAWSVKKDEDLKLTIVADATYLFGAVHADDLAYDIWFNELSRITGTTGKEDDNRRILSLTEMLEILAQHEDNLDWGRKSHLAKLSFLSDHIADISPIGPQYQIEYKVFTRKKVYRPSNITDPKVKKPTLLIEIISSEELK